VEDVSEEVELAVMEVTLSAEKDQLAEQRFCAL
jgi:hypothetical protein